MNELRIWVGKRIRELRMLRGLSQKELAYKAKMNLKNLSAIERGDYFPSNYLSELSEALDVKISDLFHFEHLTVDTDFMKEYIIKRLTTFSSEKLDMLYKLVRAMI